MLNNNVVGPVMLTRVFFAILFAISCLSSCGGADTASAAPSVLLSATSVSIPYNANTDITWSSTGSTSCTSSGGGGSGITGTFNTGTLTTTATYTVTCVGAGGSASQSITITVFSPAIASAITGFADAGGGNVTVTSVNTLTNGDAVTIQETTSYNGTYIIANQTPTSFTIAATFVADEATGIWELRTFNTGFESVNDFSGFYYVPQDHMSSASHELSPERVHSGALAHKGWIYAANPPSTPTVNNNHRGYPTIQLYKTTGGGFKTPALVEFWVWVDAILTTGFSLATLDHTTSDIWDAVLVNVSDKGFVHLMHVPGTEQSVYDFQTTTVTFPLREWVKLSICIDFTPSGLTQVWQNDVLVSAAVTGRGAGLLTQAHFGLYAPPSMSSGVIYNDDLTIKEGACNR